MSLATSMVLDGFAVLRCCVWRCLVRMSVSLGCCSVKFLRFLDGFDVAAPRPTGLQEI